jgi:hypothetical protein
VSLMTDGGLHGEPDRRTIPATTIQIIKKVTYKELLFRWDDLSAGVRCCLASTPWKVVR